MIKIKPHSLRANPLGFAGALIAAQNKCTRAWWAGDEQYSILEFPYGLHIKVRKPATSAQIESDIEDIIKQLMPDGILKIESDGDDCFRVFKLDKKTTLEQKDK